MTEINPTGDLAADLAAAGLTVTPRADGTIAVAPSDADIAAMRAELAATPADEALAAAALDGPLTYSGDYSDEPHRPAADHPYEEVARDLEVLAERLRLLALDPASEALPSGRYRPDIRVHVRPTGFVPTPAGGRAVDLVARALLPDAQPETKTSAAGVERSACGVLGRIDVSVSAYLPEQDGVAAEIARLEAQIARLKATSAVDQAEVQR